MKRLAVLGATGSIGTQTLQVVDAFPGWFEVTILAGHSNWQLLLEQAEKYKPSCVVITEPSAYEKFKQQNKNSGMTVLCGMPGVLQALEQFPTDMMVGAMSGAAGIEPTLKALELGIDLALANKETLVSGGSLVRKAQQKTGANIIPVDSEHSAIYQCIEDGSKCLNKILLTASGGPFRTWAKEDLYKVTKAQALKHPNWSMGQKITIDSASMMNKGLEVIEAKWLFDVDVRKIEILVHPQSILHSAVEFEDKSVIGQMGVPDMRIPIAFAMSYPNRLPNPREGVDWFGKAANLTFHKPDPEVFKCIKIAYDSSEAGGTYPVVMNAANEVLVDLFLQRKIRFIDIQNNLERILDEHKPSYNLDLEGILEADRLARIDTYNLACK